MQGFYAVQTAAPTRILTAVMLDAETRELLRQQVDRARREKIGQRGRDVWVSLPEAATLTGIRVGLLRKQVSALGIPTLRQGPRRLIQVQSLDQFREAVERW